MRTAFILAAGLLPLGACAGPERMVETGYPRGALGVAAIDRGDFAGAERRLMESPLDADNPARLINLGYVYLRQGRHDEAVRVWRRALAAGHRHEVVTATGRTVSTDRLAREALARYGG